MSLIGCTSLSIDSSQTSIGLYDLFASFLNVNDEQLYTWLTYYNNNGGMIFIISSEFNFFQVTAGSDNYTLALSYIGNLKGVGVPSGGTAGQVLVKKSDTDYDFEWQTLT